EREVSNVQSPLIEKANKFSVSPASEVGGRKVSPVGGSRKGAVVVSLPGVPHEMKGLMIKDVIPRIRRHFKLPFILHDTLVTYGTGESYIAEKIKDWEEKLPAHLK